MGNPQLPVAEQRFDQHAVKPVDCDRLMDLINEVADKATTEARPAL